MSSGSKPLQTARVYVDFNEILSPNEVLLSKTDSEEDSAGNILHFTPGQCVAVYMDDVDDAGEPDYLIAEGIALLNTYSGWAAAAKWLLQIDERDIRHESTEAKSIRWILAKGNYCRPIGNFV